MRHLLTAAYRCTTLWSKIHEERLRAACLATYVHACGGRNRWCRDSVSGGAGVDGGRQRANQIDRRRSQMESPIELVRRFCAAWSDNIGTTELADFFTNDAVYHNIPMAPVTGREAIAKTIA